MKLLVFYNRNAGHGKAGRRLPQVKTIATRLGIELDFRFTEHPGHATELSRDASFQGYDGVMAAGGDGTVYETLNGYLANPEAGSIPFGVLPVGTGNSFSRDVGLGTGKIEDAFSAVERRSTTRVDVGRFTTDGQTLHYLNILGVGFVSDVGVTAARLKILGHHSYTVAVLIRLLGLTPWCFDIELDGKKLSREATFIEVSNSRYTADYLMAPSARIDDGLLDVTIAGRLSRLRLLKLFPTVFTGEHVNLPEVETFQVRHMRISSSRPSLLTPDGEVLGSTPIEIECLPRALEVFTAREEPL